MNTIKTTFKRILLLVTFSALVISCGGDDEEQIVPVVPQTNTSFVKAKVNGQAFSSYIFGTSAASANISGSGSGTLIQVLGSNLNGNNISLTLLGITEPGTYDINPSLDGSVMAYTSGSGGVSYSTGECSGSGGTLVVTTLTNTKIEGTFSFTGKDSNTCDTSETKTVTEGSFRGIFVNP